MSWRVNLGGMLKKKRNRNQRRTEAKGRAKLSLTILEDRITPDVKVFTDSSLTVQVGATYTGASAILDAANNTLTSNGHYLVADTDNAPVGGYTPGTINKDLTIWGSNHGVDPNTGVRVPEVFINTASSRFSVASGRSLTIDGFSFETVGGIGAVLVNANNYTFNFTNNIVKNQNASSVNGLQLGVSGTPGILASTISHNLFDGMSTGSALRISTSSNVVVSDNVILNSVSGMQIQASLPSVSGILINNNYIANTQLSAIRLEGNVSNPVVTNNTISNANLINNAQHAGIRLAMNFTAFGGAPGVTGTPTIQNNLISNTNTGIRFSDGTFADIVNTAIFRNALDVNPGTSAVATGNIADGTIDLSGNWLGTASPAALDSSSTVSGTRPYSIKSYLSGNTNSRTGATSATSGVWGFSPNLATVEMLVPQTKATSLLTFVDGSIQSGVDRAVSGQRVRIASDTFTENVSTLSNAVTLVANSQVTVNGNMAFDNNDTILVEIGGTNPITQYSNFIVNGTVNLGNAGLSISFIGGYSVPVGTFPSFNIFNNDDTDAVVSTFNGLAESSTITSGGTTFTITYQGGTNANDVVLIRDIFPSDILLSNSSIAENNAINAVIGNFSTVDPDVGDAFMYTLVSGPGSTDNASFNISGNQLRAGISFNYEVQNSYTIRVRTTDTAGGFYEESFVINVTDVNEVPTAIALSNNIVPENAGPLYTVGTISTTDEDIGDTFTYTLVSGAGSADNGFFSISGDQLIANNNFNFESQNVFLIRIRTSDSGGLFISQAFTVIVTDVNEAPTLTLLSNNTLPENAGPNYPIGLFSTSDPDTTPQTFTYSLVPGAGSSGNAAFTIVGNQLRAVASLDFETQSSYSIRVRTTDQGGLPLESVYTITVTDLNEAPTQVNLSNQSVAENSPVGTVVGNLSTIDPDTTPQTFTNTFVGSGNDNALFTIVGNQVRTNAIFNFEAQSTYTIRVRSTDQGGLFIARNFTITVTDVNETPTAIQLSNSTVPENSPVNTAVGNFTTTDPDTTPQTFTYSLVSGTGDTNNTSFIIVGNQLQTNGVFNFEAQSSYSIRVRSTDQGSLFTESVFVITVTDVNETPTAIQLSPTSFAENLPLNTLVGSLTTTDPDTTPQTFTYTFVGSGNDNALFSIVGNQIRTNALFNFEAQSTYNIRVRSTDQGGLFIARNFTLTVTDVNEAPTAIQLSNSTVPENSPVNTPVGNFTSTDPDLTPQTFTYSLVTGSGSTDNASFTIVGSQLQTNAVFDFEVQSTFSIRVRSTDQGGQFFDQVFTINVTNINEAPTNTVPGARSVNEDTPLTFTGLNTIRVDNLEGNTATVLLSVSQGKLTVSLAGGATISPGANGTATLTLNGNQNQINAALATLTYQGNPDYNGTDTLNMLSTDTDPVPQTASSSVGITVIPVSDIVNDQLFVFGLSSVTANVITGTNGASADTFSNPARFMASVTQGSKGSVTFLANGTITYTPNYQFTGSDTFNYTVNSGGFIETGTVTVSAPSQSTFLAASSQSGGGVKQYSVSSLGSPAAQVFSIATTGAVRVAYGDVNRDGVEDIIIGSVLGTTSLVRIFNGRTYALMNSFTPFVAGSVSAVFVAAGDVNGDGFADISVVNGSIGTGANSNLRIYNGSYLATGAVVVSASTGGAVPAQGRLRDIFALNNATGSSVGNGNAFTANTGANVAMGDFNGDGLADIVVGVTGGGSARVNIYDSKVLLGTNAATAFPKPNVDLTVYNATSTAGVFVAAGDINGDGRADLVTSTSSGGPNVRVFTFAAGSKLVPTAAHAAFTNNGVGITTTQFSGTAPTLSADFLVGGANNVGVRVATRDLNNDGYSEILYTFGANQAGFASTYIGTVDGNSLRTAYSVTPYQLQLAPPSGSDYSLVTAAFAGVGTGAFIA